MTALPQGVRGVLLDIDGTLLDSNEGHARAWVQALAGHGHDVEFDRVRTLIGKGGDKLLAETVGLDDSAGDGKTIADERRKIFQRDLLPTLQPTPGARQLLQWWRDHGVKLAVATSASGEELQSLLRQAGIDDLIGPAATSSDVDKSKPDPDIVHAAIAKIGLGADEVVMLGDTPHDIQAAQAAGVACIALRCGGRWTDDDLAGAAVICDDPTQLLQLLQHDERQERTE